MSASVAAMTLPRDGSPPRPGWFIHNVKEPDGLRDAPPSTPQYRTNLGSCQPNRLTRNLFLICSYPDIAAGARGLIREFKLSPRGQGVSCDEEGPFVGSLPLLRLSPFRLPASPG